MCLVDSSFTEIAVRFDSGIRLSYDKNGQSGKKRLYWHNPLIIDPPKNKDKWASTIDCIKTSCEFVEKLEKLALKPKTPVSEDKKTTE